MTDPGNSSGDYFIENCDGGCGNNKNNNGDYDNDNNNYNNNGDDDDLYKNYLFPK